MNLRSFFSNLPRKKLIQASSVIIFMLVITGTFLYQKFSADIFDDTRLNFSMRVFDPTSGQPLSGVKATFTSMKYDVATDTPAPIVGTSDNGTLNITLPDETTYDRVVFEKMGYYDMEGTFKLDSFTSAPKEVTAVIPMDKGYGKQDIHIQSFLTGENYFSTPITLTNNDPRNFLLYYAPGESTNQFIRKYVPTLDKLFKWDDTTHDYVPLTKPTLSTFGTIDPGKGYKVVFQNEAPEIAATVVLKGKVITTPTEVTIPANNTSLVGYPLNNPNGATELEAIVGDTPYTLADAWEKGFITSIETWNSHDQKRVTLDRTNPDTRFYPGQAYWIKAADSEVKLKFINIYSNPNIPPIVQSIPIENVTVDGQPIKVEYVWLLSMHPQPDEGISQEGLDYLDRLDDALNQNRTKFLAIRENQSVGDVIEYTFNDKPVSDPYFDTQAVEESQASLIKLEVANATTDFIVTMDDLLGIDEDTTYQDICDERSSYPAKDAIFSIGNDANHSLSYFVNWKSFQYDNKTYHPFPDSFRYYMTHPVLKIEGINDPITVPKYITSHFSEPFNRQKCQRRILISFGKDNDDSWGAYFPSEMKIEMYTDNIEQGITASRPVMAEIFTGIHEVLHTIRSYKRDKSWGGVLYQGSKKSSPQFFAYEEGQVVAATHMIAKASGEKESYALVSSNLYETYRKTLDGRSYSIDKLHSFTKNLRDHCSASAIRYWCFRDMYDYFGNEWLSIMKSNPNFLKQFNVLVKDSLDHGSDGYYKANTFFDKIMSGKQVAGKPFYDWINPINRRAFAITTYYNKTLFSKINKKVTPNKAKKATPLENTVKVKQSSYPSSKYIYGYVNNLYKSLEAIPYTIYSDESNLIPSQNLRVVYYDYNNEKINEREYTTNENGDFYPLKYDMINVGRVRNVISWLRNGQWNTGTMYNANHSSESNLGIYGFADVVNDGQVSFTGPSGNETATLSKGFFSLPNAFSQEGDYAITVNNFNETIFKTIDSDYIYFLQTDTIQPEIEGSVTKEVKSDNSVEVKFTAKEEVSGLIGYSSDDKYDKVRYFDEVKKEQNPTPDDLTLNQKYNYQLLLSDRSVNSIAYTGSFTPFAINNTASAPKESSTYISYSTSIPTKGKVCYGETQDYGTCTDLVETLTSDHRVTINNLVFGKTYHYQVYAETADETIRRSEDKTFYVDNIEYGIKDLNQESLLPPPDTGKVKISFNTVSDSPVADTPYRTSVRINYKSDVCRTVTDCTTVDEGNAYSEENTTHNIMLENLMSDVRYYYTIYVHDVMGNETSIYRLGTDFYTANSAYDVRLELPYISPVGNYHIGSKTTFNLYDTSNQKIMSLERDYQGNTSSCGASIGPNCLPVSNTSDNIHQITKVVSKYGSKTYIDSALFFYLNSGLQISSPPKIISFSAAYSGYCSTVFQKYFKIFNLSYYDRGVWTTQTDNLLSLPGASFTPSEGNPRGFEYMGGYTQAMLTNLPYWSNYSGVSISWDPTALVAPESALNSVSQYQTLSEEPAIAQSTLTKVTSEAVDAVKNTAKNTGNSISNIFRRMRAYLIRLINSAGGREILGFWIHDARC